MNGTRTTEQAELPLYKEAAGSANVEWFVQFLQGRDWITAADILKEVFRPVTENEKRKLRGLADASEGRVCGHQRGYKLVQSMTQEEYNWWRNEVLKAVGALQGRVVESDKVFYSRKAA